MNYNTEKISLTRTCIDLIGSQYNVQLLDVCVSNHLSHATLSTLSYYVIVMPCTAEVMCCRAVIASLVPWEKRKMCA